MRNDDNLIQSKLPRPFRRIDSFVELHELLSVPFLFCTSNWHDLDYEELLTLVVLVGENDFDTLRSTLEKFDHITLKLWFHDRLWQGRAFAIPAIPRKPYRVVHYWKSLPIVLRTSIGARLGEFCLKYLKGSCSPFLMELKLNNTMIVTTMEVMAIKKSLECQKRFTRWLWLALDAHYLSAS